MSAIDYEYKFSFNGLLYYTAIVNGERKYYKAHNKYFFSEVSAEEFTALENLLGLWDKDKKENNNE